MEAIMLPKATTPVNPNSSLFTSHHLIAKSTLYPLSSFTPRYDITSRSNGFCLNQIWKVECTQPSRLVALCSREFHTDTHNDNTVGENPNVDYSINSNENGSQELQTNPTSENTLYTPTTSSRGLIFDLGQHESWDSIEIGSPVVKRFLSDDEERWYMWYYGSSDKHSDTGTVGLAVSTNGVHWERGQLSVDSSSGTGKVMTCSEDWWAFDTKSIRPAEVMIMSSNKVRVSSGVYWMYYTGFSSEELEIEILQDCSVVQLTEALNGRVCKALPGLVISQDGRNWARIEGDHHSGSLFDVGSKGEWDSLFVASPHVVFHINGDLRMYYHSFDPQEGRFRIGIARSRDGIKWVKLGKIKSVGEKSSSNESDWCFDERGVLNAFVVRDKKVGNYLMAYEGLGRDGKRSIGMAVSEDGLKDWRPVSDNKAVLVASVDGGWDSKGVGSPCLVQMYDDQDEWRLYYIGMGVDGKTGIGLAVSQGSELNTFRRWTGFNYV